MSYMPFELDIICPKCDFHDIDRKGDPAFIGQILGSMCVHKREYGRYRPDAWYTGSAGEASQSICFHFFDSLEFFKPKDQISFIDDYISGINDVGEKKYIKNLLVTTHKLYMTEKEPRLISKYQIKLLKLKRFFNQFRR